MNFTELIQRIEQGEFDEVDRGMKGQYFEDGPPLPDFYRVSDIHALTPCQLMEEVFSFLYSPMLELESIESVVEEWSRHTDLLRFRALPQNFVNPVPYVLWAKRTFFSSYGRQVGLARPKDAVEAWLPYLTHPFAGNVASYVLRGAIEGDPHLVQTIESSPSLSSAALRKINPLIRGNLWSLMKSLSSEAQKRFISEIEWLNDSAWRHIPGDQA